MGKPIQCAVAGLLARGVVLAWGERRSKQKRHYSESRYPAEDRDESPIVFPWDKMQAKLNASSDVWVSQPYLKKDGREIGLIIGASAERLDPKSQSPGIRETASSIYHVIEGSGYSKINGTTLQWKQGDTFCIPAWYHYQHFADGDSKVYLYRFDDKPMLNALGFYRVEGVDTEKYVTQ